MPSTWGNRLQYGEFKIVGAAEGHPKLLGEGSFGKTFEAERYESVAGEVIREPVALKVLNPELLNSASKRLQFVQERTALTRLKHANLVHSIKCGEDKGADGRGEGEVYFAMELCMGGDLSKLVKRFGALPERVVALIGLQAAVGLREMHRRDMVHRDIKPPNIMLFEPLSQGCTLDDLTLLLEENDSLCRIVDFGLVGTIINAQGNAGPASQQKFVGSMMYASPEQILERKDIDGRTDLYALGMTLWYLLQGRGPLLDARGDELKHATEAEGRHLSNNEHESDLPNNLSQEFRGILARMVAKRPEDRMPSARELATTLERYLERSIGLPPPPSRDRLRSFYQFTEDNFKSIGRRRFAAEHCPTRKKARLTIVEDLDSDNMGRIRADFHDVLKKIWNLAQSLRLPDVPATILPVQDVIYSADALAYAEDVPGDVTLAEVLQARTASKRSFSFREAEVIFRPIAEALDYLTNHGWDLISLPCEEVWLSDSVAASSPGDRKVLCRPLDEWQGLRVTFSGMWVPPEKGRATGAELSFASTSQGGSSFMTAESLRPPVSAFLRLVYRTLSGSDVPDAADRWQNGYISSVSLQTASNNLIRDLLCKQREWSSVSLILNELCANEGVSVDAPVVPQQERVGSRGGSGTAKAAPGSGVVAPPVASTGTSRSGSRSTGSSRSVAPEPPPQRAAGSSGSRPSAAVNEEGPSLREARDASDCEILSPGVVRLGDHIKEMSPIEWVTKEFIKCDETKTWFHIPSEGRGLFEGKVEQLKHVFSPYSEEQQEVDWTDWRPGGQINCYQTGHPFLLPLELPLPTGRLPDKGTGQVINFYDPQSPPILVPPAEWVPGGRITCPTTHNIFLLPDQLPPLEAKADVRKPGWVTSPYEADAPWTIPPTDWYAGREIKCNSTGKPLTLPREVEQWVAEATVVDVAAREVQSPYQKDARCVVPTLEWQRGGSVKCPPAGRVARLPMDLPLLIGQVVPGTPCVIRSPFSGETITVPCPNWITGREVICKKSGQPFLLPPSLPIPDGSVLKDKPGLAFSPYDPTRTVKVEPLHWLPGEVLTCPATSERFKLPDKLPPLHAIVTPGDPGVVRSPFAPEAEDENKMKFDFIVPIDDWVAGKDFECPITKHIFILPPGIEEWIKDGTWVPGVPGKVRSPFRNGGEIDLSDAQWKPGAIVTCPVTKRRFSVPVTKGFPSLALEKAAVHQAHSEPEADEKAAVAALKKGHQGVTEAVITAIWARHHLDTVEKRLPKELGIVKKDEPGFVVSPYDGKRMSVPPETWVLPGASLLCETGKRFLLPPDRPQLLGVVDGRKPGWVTSPFATDKPFQIKPWQWLAGAEIICEHTDHTFVLPSTLSTWVPEAALDAKKLGCVINPFSATGDSLTVNGQDWTAENILSVSGRQYKLPRNLPPLVARLEKAVRGKVESPYAPGTIITVKPDAWTPGAAVTCSKTKREFLLPEGLPDDAFEAIDPHEDGTVQSPYGKGLRFKVLALEWISEGVVRCPETNKKVVLPKALPLLIGQVDPDRPCEARSPFAPDVPVRLDVADWIEGREVSCEHTQRTFRLPKESLPLPFAELASGKPGGVLSPFRSGAEITVPPANWIEGGEWEDRTARRRFRLPKSGLPLLEAVMVAGRSLLVKSPFDPKAEVSVALADWTPGHELTCPTTKRSFVLPQHLDEPVLPAKLIDGRPGWIIDPYTNEELEIPGPDWNESATITSAEDRKIVLPAKLPPLSALLVDGSPLRIQSPYDPEVFDTVPVKKWIGGSIVKCGKRNVQLPNTLPTPPVDVITRSPFPWAAIAGVSVCLLLAGGGGWYFLAGPGAHAVTVTNPTKDEDKGSDESSKKQKDESSALPAITDPLEKLRLEFTALKSSGNISTQFIDEILKLNTDDPAAKSLADEVLSTAKNHANIEIKQKALLAIAKRMEPKSEEALGAYLDACTGPSSEARDWIISNVGRLTAPLFEKAHGVLNPTDKSRLISAGKNPDTSNQEVAATSWFLFAKQEQAIKQDVKLIDPAVRQAYYEAASLQHKGAQELLTEKVVAIVDPAKPLEITRPYAGTKPEPVKSSDWKDGQKLPALFVKLPAGLPGLTAIYEEGKHRPPTDSAPGTVGNPYGGEDVKVPIENWYPLAKIENPKVTLPAHLPLIAAKIDPALFTSTDDLVTAQVTSPRSKNLVSVPWKDWLPGHEIKETIGQTTSLVAALAPGKAPDEIDPCLPSPRATLAAEKPSKNQPPVVTCMAVSPYSGKVRIPIKEWIGGGKLRDASFDADGKGPLLSFTLPAVLDPIPGILKDDYQFAYLDDAGNPVTISLKDKAFTDFLNITDFKHGAQLFRIVSYLNFFVEESEWQGFDSRRGKNLSKSESDAIRRQRSADSERLADKVELTGDFKKYADGQDMRPKKPEPPPEPKVTMPQKVADAETKPKPTPDAPQKPVPGKDSTTRSTSKTAQADANKPPAPTSKNTQTKTADVPPPASSSGVEARYAKSFVAPMNGISFRYKNGAWSAGKGAMLPGGDPSEFARRLEGSLKTSGKIPRSASVSVQSDGSIIIK